MVSDGELDSNIGTVTINVTPVNDEPIDQNDRLLLLIQMTCLLLMSLPTLSIRMVMS